MCFIIENDEALAALIYRRDPNATWYGSDLSSEEVDEIFRRKIAEEL